MSEPRRRRRPAVQTPALPEQEEQKPGSPGRKPRTDGEARSAEGMEPIRRRKVQQADAPSRQRRRPLTKKEKLKRRLRRAKKTGKRYVKKAKSLVMTALPHVHDFLARAGMMLLALADMLAEKAGRAAQSAIDQFGVKRGGERRPPSRRKNRSREEFARRALAAVFACVAVYCVFMIGSIMMRTIKTTRLNDELAQMHAEAMDAGTDSGESQADGESAMPGQQAEPAALQLTDYAAGAAESNIDAPVPTPEAGMDATEVPMPTSTPKKDVVTSTIYHQVGGEALPEMEKLYNQNHDLVGWLTMEEVLDLPVVYKDNSYYLTHDFYKNKSTSGTIFLDVNHPFRARTQNLLLHGHNMKDGTMFGRLTQYENITYLKNNPFIEFSTLWKKERYVIFAVLNVSLDVKNDRFFNYYSYPTFSSDAAFSSYIRGLELSSIYAIPMDVQPSDALLTLSTCLDDDRLVIVARRQRENESKSELRQIVQLAVKQ